MNDTPTGAIDVKARLDTPIGQAQLVEYHFNRPALGALRTDDTFRIELCLTARHRSARACFRDRWPARRFERVGDMFIIYPGADLIAMSDEATSLPAIVYEFDAAPILDMFEARPQPNDDLLMASLDIRNERVRSLLLWTAEEARHPSFASQTLAELMCTHLTIELFRHGAQIYETKRQGGLASWRMRLIEERLAEPGPAPSASELAALCRISVSQLARGFRVSRGAPLGAYIAQHQIERAKTMLNNGESVAAIATRLGFATSSSFCFAFRRACGLSPHDYRRRLF